MRGFVLTTLLFPLVAGAAMAQLPDDMENPPPVEISEGSDFIYDLKITEARPSNASDLVCNADLLGRPLIKGSVKYRNNDIKFGIRVRGTNSIIGNYSTSRIEYHPFQSNNSFTIITLHHSAPMLHGVREVEFGEWYFYRDYHPEYSIANKIEGNENEGIIYFEACDSNGDYDVYKSIQQDDNSIGIDMGHFVDGSKVKGFYTDAFDWGVGYEDTGDIEEDSEGEEECPFDAQAIAGASPNLLAEFAAEHPPCYEPVRERVCAEVIADYEALIDYGPQPALIELSYQACGGGAAQQAAGDSGTSDWSDLLETPMDPYLLEFKQWALDRMTEGAVGSEGVDRLTLALVIGLTDIMGPESVTEIVIGYTTGFAGGAVIRIGGRYADDAFSSLRRIWKNESGSVPYIPIKPNLNLDHIFHGEVRRGRLSGFHYRDLVDPTNGARVVRRGPPDANGSYRAEIEVNINGVLYKKGNIDAIENDQMHTMFSDSWSRSRVEIEIYEAFYSDTKITRRNLWEGVSSSGVRIRGYIDENGDIYTAFPILQ